MAALIFVLLTVLSARSESLSTPTKLSLRPLKIPAAAATGTNQFVLAFEPRPKPIAATDTIPPGSSLVTRRLLEAARCLQHAQSSEKGAFAGLFSAQPGDRGFRVANIQAGYGMVCRDPAFTRGRNGTATEEPSFVFLKTSVKF